LSSSAPIPVSANARFDAAQLGWAEQFGRQAMADYCGR